jgi:hypothetical protein
LFRYDSSQDYAPSLSLKKADVLKFIEKFAFNGGNSDVQLSLDAYNFLMYLLLQNRILLADTAYQLMVHREKASVDFKAFAFGVNIHFKGGLKKSLSKKLDEKYRICKKMNIDAEEKSENNDEDGDSDEEEKTPKKKSKGSKDTKTTKDAKSKNSAKGKSNSKKGKKDETEDESSGQSESEESDDGDSD